MSDRKKKKAAKPLRPKARRPRGFEDKPADVLRLERGLIEAASSVYERSGFAPLATPAFEFADAIGKFLPDAERPNEGVFALQDDDEQWMALRYDLTAPTARYVAENMDALPRPFRRYAVGTVWRNEKPGPGRFREFIQCDADSIGAPGAAADAEMIALALDVLRSAGLADDEAVMRVNDRRLLDGVLAQIDLPATTDGEARRQTVLRAIDKLDRLGPAGVEALLGEGRKDESGDVTDGAHLDAAGIKAVMGFVTAGVAGRGDTLAALERRLGAQGAARPGLDALAEIDRILDRLGVDEARAVYDPSIVRGLAYYTGPVFEAEITFEVTNEKGKPVRIGSVGSGGRYDDLVGRFKGQPMPGTGFSLGVTRLAAALAMADRAGQAAAARPLAVVLALEPDRMADYLALAASLRARAGVDAEVYLGGANMAKQLKYADKRGARFAVIIGEDERKARKATIKDLALGALLSAEVATNAEWRAARPAQETVARGQLAPWIKRAVKAGLPQPEPAS